MHFIKNYFVVHSANGETWVSYNDTFVARFKYLSHKATANDFVRSLIKNFTVEEYFEKLENLPPVRVLEEKGWIVAWISKSDDLRLAYKRFDDGTIEIKFGKARDIGYSH